jgi:hypothetical protein
MDPAPTSPRPALTGQAAAERLRQYENLRRQALAPETGETSDRSGRERAFLEHQGLVAWMKHAADYPSVGVVPGDKQTPPRGESALSPNDLVQALASLVVGDRQEVPHG